MTSCVLQGMARDVLFGTRAKLVNNVRGWMRTQLWKVRSGATLRSRIECEDMQQRQAKRCPGISLLVAVAS